MQFKFSKIIGKSEFVFQEKAADIQDFFKKAAFFQGLPSVGPGGETDLIVTYRTTSEGHKYFSIVSEEAGQEMQYGQPKTEDGSLFEKSWAPLYNASANANKTATPAATKKKAKSETTVTDDEVMEEYMTM